MSAIYTEAMKIMSKEEIREWLQDMEERAEYHIKWCTAYPDKMENHDLHMLAMEEVFLFLKQMSDTLKMFEETTKH